MCRYCDSWLEKDTLYQKNVYANLLIGNALGAPALKVNNNFASKDMFFSIAYKINYCPECGRRLKEKDRN